MMTDAKYSMAAVASRPFLMFLSVGAVVAVALMAQTPVYAGDRGTGVFGDDTSRWKRTANFVSDRTLRSRFKRRKNDGKSRTRALAGSRTVPASRRGQLLIAFPAETSDQLVDSVAEDHSLSRIEDITVALLNQRVVKFKVARTKQKGAQRALAKDKRILSVQPNHLYVLGSPDKAQYTLKTLGLKEIHAFADGTDIRIAMLDSGINQLHPAFGGLQIEEFDATDSAPNTTDGHGTAVASLIAAQTDMTGVVPNPDLLSAKTFAYSRRWRRTVGETYHLLQGLDWAVFKKARVFNMSFAGPKDPLMQNALLETLKTDAVIVAAAGNNGAKAAPAYPAAYEGVIAVTATDRRNRLYRHANRGKYVFVAAPGVKVLTASAKDGYSRKSGTSLAAAHVTGIVALMLQNSPDSTANTIAKQLADTASDLGKAGRDTSFGHGMINPVKLITPPPLTN